MSYLDKNLNMSSGIINMVLAFAVMVVILFVRSEAVTTPLVIGGLVVFGSMFMYGVQKFLTAYQS